MERSFDRNELLKQVLNNKVVETIVKENNISIDELDKNLLPVLSYTFKCKECVGCTGLDKCVQPTVGYEPTLTYDGAKFTEDTAPCSYLQVVNLALEKNKNLKLISCSVSNFDFSDIYINPKRKQVMEEIKNCFSNYEKGINTKGLYIHGRYGCGKTYLLAYLAQQFATNNHQVIFAYYPDLVRSFKSSISDGTLEDKIEELKDIEILVLDDFGGETTTAFIRDEVLSAILQERMTNNKLTFMSSNLNEKLLIEHLSESQKEVDSLRASRVHERIRALMNFIELDDQNYRR